jgi:nucleoside-diphosphate-sugar epimerase
MNILVTGGAGFIGSNLCDRLLKDGHHVWSVDNFITGDKKNIEPLLKKGNFTFCNCAVEDSAFLKFCEKASNGFDRIYHLACATGVPNIATLGEEMLLACSIGTWNVLKVAQKMDAKVLFTSSSEVYGEPLEIPQHEHYTGNVATNGLRSNYEEGKRFSETLVSHFVRSHNIHAVMVRLFNAYGPNMSLSDTRVIPRFSMQALANKPITVQGDGSQSRTLCFVSDILNGFEIVFSKGKPGEIFNLGSDIEITMKDLALLVKKMIKSSSEIHYVPRPEHDHSSRMPVLNKIKTLGWNMETDLERGLLITIEDFKKRLYSGSSYRSDKKIQLQS